LVVTDRTSELKRPGYADIGRGEVEVIAHPEVRRKGASELGSERFGAGERVARDGEQGGLVAHSV
jgi:hypothetical protein